MGNPQCQPCRARVIILINFKTSTPLRIKSQWRQSRHIILKLAPAQTILMACSRREQKCIEIEVLFRKLNSLFITYNAISNILVGRLRGGDFSRSRIKFGAPLPASRFLVSAKTQKLLWNFTMAVLATWGCAGDFLKMLPKFKMSMREKTFF